MFSVCVCGGCVCVCVGGGGGGGGVAGYVGLGVRVCGRCGDGGRTEQKGHSFA